MHSIQETLHRETKKYRYFIFLFLKPATNQARRRRSSFSLFRAVRTMARGFWFILVVVSALLLMLLGLFFFLSSFYLIALCLWYPYGIVFMLCFFFNVTTVFKCFCFQCLFRVWTISMILVSTLKLFVKWFEAYDFFFRKDEKWNTIKIG